MFTHSTPIPTDDDLKVTHPSPSRLLHPGVPADRMYHLIMKEKLWRSWSGDSFGIKYLETGVTGAPPVDGKPFEADVKGVALSIRDRMIVRDSKDGTPVAVIVGLFFTWETTYKIYTFSQNVEGQAPSDTQKYNGRDLYEYAICRDKMLSVRKTMQMIDGVEYVMDGVGAVLAAKRQMVVSRNGKACMYAKARNLGIVMGSQWELKIAPGIDPVLMVAFMAVMDEMNEE